jgi:hypothetical protein
VRTFPQAQKFVLKNWPLTSTRREKNVSDEVFGVAEAVEILWTLFSFSLNNTVASLLN